MIMIMMMMLMMLMMNRAEDDDADDAGYDDAADGDDGHDDVCCTVLVMTQKLLCPMMVTRLEVLILVLCWFSLNVQDLVSVDDLVTVEDLLTVPKPAGLLVRCQRINLIVLFSIVPTAPQICTALAAPDLSMIFVELLNKRDCSAVSLSCAGGNVTLLQTALDS